MASSAPTNPQGGVLAITDTISPNVTLRQNACVYIEAPQPVESPTPSSPYTYVSDDEKPADTSACTENESSYDLGYEGDIDTNSKIEMETRPSKEWYNKSFRIDSPEASGDEDEQTVNLLMAADFDDVPTHLRQHWVSAHSGAALRELQQRQENIGKEGADEEEADEEEAVVEVAEVGVIVSAGVAVRVHRGSRRQ